MSQSRLPRGIYWRRRLLLVALLIAIVWVVLRFTGGNGDEPAATSGSTATPSPTTSSPAASAETPAPSASPTPGATTPAPDQDAVPVALRSATTACDPETVRVTPSVRPDQTSGAAVSVGLVMSSTEAEPCTLTAADADLLVVISADSTPVYDSTVCKKSLLTEPVSLSPDWSTFVVTRWSGRGSGAGCSAEEGFAPPGEYTIAAGTLGGEPGRMTFDLERKAKKPTPEPSAEPTTTPAPPKTTARPADTPDE